MAYVKLNCGICNKEFNYYKSEYNRQVNKGRSVFYCSLSCAGKRDSEIVRLKEIGKPYFFKGGENKLVSPEQKLRSSMKEFLRRIRGREKHKPEKFGESKLTVDDLIDLWKQQKGKCYYSNVELLLPNDEAYKKSNLNHKASIDRVDSSLGYSLQNIKFVSCSINYLKSTMNENEVKEFILLIKQS